MPIAYLETPKPQKKPEWHRRAVFLLNGIGNTDFRFLSSSLTSGISRCDFWNRGSVLIILGCQNIQICPVRGVGWLHA